MYKFSVFFKILQQIFSERKYLKMALSSKEKFSGNFTSITTSRNVSLVVAGAVIILFMLKNRVWNEDAAVLQSAFETKFVIEAAVRIQIHACAPKKNFSQESAHFETSICFSYLGIFFFAFVFFYMYFSHFFQELNFF